MPVGRGELVVDRGSGSRATVIARYLAPYGSLVPGIDHPHLPGRKCSHTASGLCHHKGRS